MPMPSRTAARTRPKTTYKLVPAHVHTPTLIFILPAPITQIRLRVCQNWSGLVGGGLLATLARFAVTVLNPNPTILPEYPPPPRR